MIKSSSSTCRKRGGRGWLRDRSARDGAGMDKGREERVEGGALEEDSPERENRFVIDRSVCSRL